MALRLLRNHAVFTDESHALQISLIYPLMAVTVTQRLRPRIVVFRLADLIEGLLLFCSNVTAAHRLLQSLCVMDDRTSQSSSSLLSSVIAAKPKCTSDEDRFMLKSEK